MMSDIEAILEISGVAAVEAAASALAKSGGPRLQCPNCGHPLVGPYCAICGQPHDIHRRSVWRLLHDFVADLASFDSRIARTAVALLVEPGELPKAFREGRTQRFVPALRLYLFVSLIFFLMLSVTGLAIMQLEIVATPQKVVYDAKGNAFITNPAYDPADHDVRYVPQRLPIAKEKAKRPGGVYSFTTRAHFFSRIGAYPSHLPKYARDQLARPNLQIEIKAKDDSAKGKKAAAARREAVAGWINTDLFGGIRRLAADPAAVNGPMTTWIPRVLFLLLPLYALLLAMFYFRERKKFFFVDHLIFSLTIHTFTFVVLMIAAGLAQMLPGEVVLWLVLAALGIYIFVAMKRFYEQSWFWTSVKFAAVSFIYVCFFLLPALGGVLIMSFFGG